MPQVVPAGKDAKAATHAGMLPLLKRMATIIRTRFTPDFYQGVMDEALEQMAGEVTIDADAFTKAVNGARAASGLPPLVSAEGEVAQQLEEALMAYRERWTEEMETIIQSRVKSALDAHVAATANAGRVPDAGGYDGDPPPPRGGARKGR